MGTGKVTARRGANGEVEYDTSQVVGSPDSSFGKSGVDLSRTHGYNKRLNEGKAIALRELQGVEETAIRNKTSALASTVGSVAGASAGYSNASSSTRAPEGNPGMDDPEASADIDLSTSDTTARRKAGYRRDSGIRI